MKKHLYLWLTGVFLLLVLAGGCSSGGGKEDIPSPPNTPSTPTTPPTTEKDYINSPTSSFQSDDEGGDVQISFTTNQGWTASSDQVWCKLSATSGDKGSLTLTATIEKNTTPEDRTATITLKAGTVQKALSITQERQYQLKVDYDNTPIDFSGGTISVKVECNTEFEISCDATWLHQVKDSASRSMKEQTIQFEADFNDEEAIRETEITFFNTEKNLKETIKIKQEAKPEDNTANPSGNIGNMTWG